MEDQSSPPLQTIKFPLEILFDASVIGQGFFSDDNNVAFLVSIWILAIMYTLLFFFSILR